MTSVDRPIGLVAHHPPTTLSLNITLQSLITDRQVRLYESTTRDYDAHARSLGQPVSKSPERGRRIATHIKRYLMPTSLAWSQRRLRLPAHGGVCTLYYCTVWDLPEIAGRRLVGPRRLRIARSGPPQLTASSSTLGRGGAGRQREKSARARGTDDHRAPAKKDASRGRYTGPNLR